MTKNILKNKLTTFLKSKIFLVFILAFIIRTFFVYQDYPFVLHPDEPTVVNSTISLRYDLNPKHFDWPTFYYYFNYPFFFVYEKIYFILNDLKIINDVVIPKINYYIISRFLTVSFGALTAIVIYLILKNLKVSNTLALIGAAIMAIIPFHVTRSAQALTDVPMLFFTAVSVYFLTKNIEEFKDKYFISACFFAGLAVSTKYNGYMIFLSLGLFIFYIKGFNFKDIKLYLKSGFASFMGFFIGTPYAIFDYQTFLITDSPKGALWQFNNVGKVEITQQFTNFYKNISVNYIDAMGYIPLILSIIFIILFFYTRDFYKKDNYYKFLLIMVIQFIFILWSVSGVRIQRVHYLIMLYMFLPIFSVMIFHLYLKSTKFVNFIYFITVLACLFQFYLKIDDLAIIKFYKNAEFISKKENYFFLYNRSEAGLILKELKLPSEKTSQTDLTYSSKTTHAIVSYDMCQYLNPCNFELIRKIESRSDPDIIYVFRKK
jgi:hypothetical protein